MLDEVSYRCINTACGRGMPRPVAFCPYCGARQAAAPAQPAVVAQAPPVAPSPPPPVAPPVAPPAPPPPVAPPPAPPPPPVPPPVEPPPPPPAAGKPAPPPLRRPVRKRTWLTVIAALAAIWFFAKPGDTGKAIESRVEGAMLLAADCKIDQARTEMTALKTAKANPAQLQRLQNAIAETLPGCEKKRLRAKAWSETGAAIDAALQDGATEKAAGRLAAFARRWGDDAETAALGAKIELRKGERLLDDAVACLAKSDRVCLENRLLAVERLKRTELSQRIMALRESLSRLLEASLLGAPQVSAPAPAAPAVLSSEPPRGAPPPPRVISTAPGPAAEPANQGAQQARKIVADAEREVGRGNYRSAIDKLDICATMIDVGNRECLALKQKAERLNRDMLRCVAGGSDWNNERCN